jgi:DNA polymerase V
VDNAVVKKRSNVQGAIPHINEAKALGIKMGDPEFKIRDLIKRKDVKVFSSNYALYGSLSGRVTDTLLTMVPTIETYSIDESFLNLGEFHEREVEPLARELCERVRRWVGILGAGPKNGPGPSGRSIDRHGGPLDGMNCPRFGQNDRAIH